MFIYPLLLWRARHRTAGGQCVTSGQRPPETPLKSVEPCPSVKKKIVKTFNNGSLGSGIDEERSEMR